MAEEKKPNPAVTFLATHGEKLALGAAVLMLLLYIFFGVIQAEEGTEVKKLDEKIATIDREIKLEHDAMKPPPLKPYDVEAFTHWNKVSSAASADDWSATLLPKFAKNAVEVGSGAVVVETTKDIFLPGISMKEPQASIEGVSLTWAVDPVDEETAEKYDVKKITSFTLERELVGSGKWEVLAKDLPGETLTYRDTDIKPRTEYNYRVTSHCNEMAYTAKHPDGKGDTKTTAAPIKTVSLWSLKFIQTMKDMARIEIEKYDLQIGDRIKITRNHYNGDKIGWWPETKGGKPTSKHRIFFKGKSIMADFNTGMKLVSVTPDVPYKGEFKRCKEKFDPSGNYVSCDTVTESRTVKLDKIIYTDEDGKEQTIFRPAPKNHTLLKDQLCSRCRAPEVTVAKGTGEGTTKGADPEAANREAEAKKMFEKAIKVEKVVAFRAFAVTQYTKLLKEYGDTQFVTEKKAVIEEKLAALTGKSPK